MNATLIGSQLGDEGKGGIVDVFSDDADVVVRYQGGDNAGHTVAHDGAEFKLRLVPSGVVRGAVGVLGNGCVINLETLFSEIDRLRERGIEPDVRLSERAHLVLPYHRVLDAAAENAKQELAVGTTGNGIGPAYEDKAGRRGIRVAEALRPELLRSRLEHVVPQKRRLVESVFDRATGDAFDVEAIFETLRTDGERLASEGMVIDAGSFLSERARAGDRILFEGAQGTHLDIDHGDYPFVTSSNPTTGGAIVGSGIDPTAVTDGAVVGVVKAYLTRVGRGPMPTEMDEETASWVRQQAGEFGTVTGRSRRIGWLDLPMLRHAARVNGFSAVTINHVDVLGGLDELRVCESYDLDGETITGVPATAAEWDRCTPNYRSLDTWGEQDWRRIAARGYDALPENARAYVEYVTEELDVSLCAVSIGPERDQTIVVRDPFARVSSASV